MASNKENAPKINYCIKLLAGNNVVLVEANHYESEIFVPQIINGRITFVNIIPNRRCCQKGGRSLKCSPNLLNDTTRTQIAKGHIFRMSAGQGPALPVPLANSTPAGVNKIKSRSVSGLATSTNPYNTNNESLETPEPVRKAVPTSRRVFNNNSNTIEIPKGLKVMPLYHDSVNSDGTPKKLGRLVATSSIGSQNLANLSILNGSIRPQTPSMPNSSTKRKSSSISSSNYLQSALGTVTKWRKVIMPLRTYSKRSDQPVMIRRSTPVCSAKKSFKSRKVIPTFLVNPTQAPKATHKVEMMKRRLIIDGQVSISPRTFKKQTQQPISPTINRKPLTRNIKLQSSPSALQMSAFDLLTNSNRFHSMNDKLKQQFRKGCINKACSTYNKYKILSTVPPLQEDEQILDISQKTPQNVSSGQATNPNIVINKAISTQIRMPSTADIQTEFKSYRSPLTINRI